MADLFISYAREDQQTVRKLHAACAARERESWVDWEGIEPSDTWLQSIYEAIDAADAVLVVLSPDWIASVVCRLEAEHAIAAHKRLIPVVARDVDLERERLPPELAELNWIFAREGVDDVETAADAIVRALDTELGLVRTHTLVLTRARAWELAGRRRSPLLRGDELGRAEAWVARAAAGARPQPTELQAAFIEASRRAARSRARLAIGGSAAVAAVATTLAIFALISRSHAIHESHVAFGRELTADSTALVGTDPELGLLLAQRALHVDPSPAAKLAFVTAFDNTTERAIVHFGGNGVIDAAWSPNANLVALAGQNGSIGLWNPSTNHVTATLRADGRGVDAVAFSRDGRLLASGGNDDQVHIWNVATHQLEQTLSGHTALIDALSFSDDGRYVVSGAYDGSARVWSLASGKAVATLVDPGQSGGHVTGVAIGPQDRFVVTANEDDGYTAVWRFMGGRWTPVGYRPPLASQAPRRVALSPDGREIAIAGEDGAVRLWKWQGRAAPRVLKASSDPLLAVAYSRNGALVAAGGDDGSVRVWHASSGELLERADGERGAVDGVAFSPDGRRLATAGSDATGRLWRVTSNIGAVERVLEPSGGLHEVVGGTIVGARRTIVVETGDGTMHGWSASGVRLWQRRVDAAQACACTLAGDRDGTQVAGGTSAGVDVLTARSGSIVRRLAAPRSIGVAIAGSADLVAAGGVDNKVRLWRIDSGHLLFSLALQHRDGNPFSVAFAPDGAALAIGLQSGHVRLVSASSGRVERELTGPAGPVYGIAFSPDGKLVVAASADKRIWIWRRSNGSVVRALGADTGPVDAVAISPDGKLLASASDDQLARIWNLATGSQVRLLNGDTDWVTSIAFASDGRSVLTTSLDGEARLWDSCSWCDSVAELEAHARPALVRCLTAGEQTQYLHERQPHDEPCSA